MNLNIVKSKAVFSVMLIWGVLLFQCKGIPSSKASALKTLGSVMQNKNNPIVYVRTYQGGSLLGNIVLELYSESAPKTVKNFIGLAEGSISYVHPKTQKIEKKPYYNNVIFHRVIPNFMIQSGDILGTGTGGPGFQFEDEINANSLGLDKVILKTEQSYQRDAQQMVFKKLKVNSEESYHKNKKKIEKELKKMSELSVKEVLEGVGYVFKDKEIALVKFGLYNDDELTRPVFSPRHGFYLDYPEGECYLNLLNANTKVIGNIHQNPELLK